MLKHFFSWCLCVFLLVGCVTRLPAPGVSDTLPPSVSGKHVQHTLLDVQARRVIAFDSLVDAVAAADVVAIGEEHHHPDIQAFALHLLQAVAQRRPQQLALAMEFLERDQQATVDAYLAGTIDQLTLQNRLGVSAAFMRDYFPLLQYARQQALPVIAMNIPRRIARQVAREGLEKTLQQLSSRDRAHLPVALSAIAPSYRGYFLQAVAAHHQVHGEQAEYFVQASHLKDDTMAESLARFLAARPGYTIVALAGRFHFDYGKAIPALLQQRRQHTVMPRITAMAVAEDRVIDLQQYARDDLAHYLRFSPPAPEEHSRRSTRVVTLLRQF
jgi:uncharacterized iron-regulated protein